MKTTARILPTTEEIKENIHYDPDTGEFTWAVSKGKMFKGVPAGTSRADGYRSITINRSRHLAHRMAWVITHGEWPVGVIDHINGDPSDNRIANLRAATHSENMRNARKSCRNTSGHKGVAWDRRSRRWRVKLNSEGKDKHIGVYRNIADAVAAYAVASRRYHGEFSRLE